MPLRTETTLAGYARAAVDLRTRMIDYHRGPLAEAYLHPFLDEHINAHPEATEPVAVTDDVVRAMHRITASPWQVGEPFVCAPAMTAIVAAAAEALDLTGEVLDDDAAPCDSGVLLLPEPIYHRLPGGAVSSIGAITWARTTSTGTGRSCWFIAGWAERDDPDDPAAAERRRLLAGRPDLAAQFGPYVLTDLAEIPIGRPVDPRADLPVVNDADRDWQAAPDGRYCLDETTVRTGACAAIAYAFWRIQAQPLATVAAPPVDRPARRRAARAGIRHDTRVVMLRRTSGQGEPGGEAKWHYRVRFMVRGHWRRLTTSDGRRYRIWIHAHIKGPDGAPLLHGEKVAILAR
jgi:hypothetical protein